MCERELETEQNCYILNPTLMAVTIVSFSFSWCSTGGPGAQLSAGFLYQIFTNSPDLQLIDFLSSTSYIIVFSWSYIYIDFFFKIPYPVAKAAR